MPAKEALRSVVQKLLKSLADVVEENVDPNKICNSHDGSTPEVKALVLVNAARYAAEGYEGGTTNEGDGIELNIANLMESGKGTITLSKDRGRFYVEISDEWTNYILKIFSCKTFAGAFKAASEKKDGAEFTKAMSSITPENASANEDVAIAEEGASFDGELKGPEDDELIDPLENTSGEVGINTIPDAPTPGRNDQPVDHTEDAELWRDDAKKDANDENVVPFFGPPKNDDLPGQKTFPASPPEPSALFHKGGAK